MSWRTITRNVCLNTVIWVTLLTAPVVCAQSGRQSRQFENITLKTDIPYANSDNPRQQLNLLIPKSRTDKPIPVIVFIHGGAWQAGDRKSGHRRLARYVATGKYAGASIGYRLTKESKWPAQIHDCKAAIRWIRGNADKFNLDATRIGVVGDSAGGHLVSMLGTSQDVKELEGDLGIYTTFDSRVRCVVNMYGPSDLPAMKDYPSRLDHNNADSPEGKLVGGRVSENRKIALAASPITYVSDDDPPILIMHGDDDRVVPYNQSQRFSRSLKKAKVECTFITIEGGGHGGFRNPEVQRRERQFFEKHLLDATHDISEKAIPSRATKDSSKN